MCNLLLRSTLTDSMSSSSPTLTFRLVTFPTVCQISNKPRRNQRGASVVPICADLQSSALSSLFRLRFGLHSTSAATVYISEISLKTHFDCLPSRVSRCTRCLATCHVLLLLFFNLSSRCAIPSAPTSMHNTPFRPYQTPLSNAPAHVLNNGLASDHPEIRPQTFLPPLWRLLCVDLDVKNLYGTSLVLTIDYFYRLL